MPALLIKTLPNNAVMSSPRIRFLWLHGRCIKVCRGDAIAGILILIINIVGGLIVGTTQHELTLGDAGRIYVLLTIGDGLVAQIPSLLSRSPRQFWSLASRLMKSMAEQASKQVADANGVFIASGIVTLLGLIPGKPHFVFLPLGAAGIGLGYYIRQQAAEEQRQEANAESTAEVEPTNRELDWEDIDQVEVIALDIGYGLVPLANTQSGGQLLTRIRGIRKKLSAELGF